VSLIARHLEAHHIPTLVLGSARDILLAGQPPRACFVDYPLGHATGKPFDRADQADIVRASLEALVTSATPGALQSLPNRWADDVWRTQAGAITGQDTRQPRDESPQFQLPGDRAAALASGALRVG